MIKSAHLKNIRCHLDTFVEFGPGFNVIGGESDEGKSVIFWAINWALFNPKGWNPRPWKKLKPGKESRVDLVLFTGDKISRVRTSKENYYELNGEKLSPQGGVPEKVRKILNVDASNVQIQKDMFFLLDNTSGQAAREISKVANLEEMDKALGVAASRVKESSRRVSSLREDIKTETDKLENYSWLESVKDSLQGLISAEDQLNKKKDFFNSTKKIYQTCLQAEKELQKFPTDSVHERIVQLEKDIVKYKKRENKGRQLVKLFDSASSIQASIADIPDTEDRLNELDVLDREVSDSQEKKDRIIKLGKQLNSLNKLRDSLDSLPKDTEASISSLRQLKQESEHIEYWRTRIHSAKILYTKLQTVVEQTAEIEKHLTGLRGKIETCPTCGTEFKEGRRIYED